MPTTLHLRHPDVEGNHKTTISTASAAAASSLTVVNTNQMITDEYVIIGGYGSATAELILTGTISTDTALPLATNTDFAHAAGTVVQHVFYNQIEIDYSTDLDTLWTSGAYATLSDASDAATWVNLSTVDIEISQKETVVHDTNDSRAYRARYKNADDTAYSAYFYIKLSSGFNEFGLEDIATRAARITNKKISPDDTGQINIPFLIEQANTCIRKVHSKRKRWSYNQSFDVVMSEITSGQNDYLVPNNIDISDTNKSTFNVRINDGHDLGYMDKNEFDIIFKDVHNSELAGALSNVSATIVLDDTSDFPDSGSFTVTTGTTQDTVDYSANNRSTNTLTVTDAASDVTTTHATDTDVWINAPYGTPRFYTIYDGKMHFDAVPNTLLYQRTIKIDFYKKLVMVNSFDDYIIFPDPNLVYFYLCEAIAIKANTKTDRYWRSQFDDALADLLKNEATGQKKYLVPRTRKYFSRHSRIGKAVNEYNL